MLDAHELAHALVQLGDDVQGRQAGVARVQARFQRTRGHADGTVAREIVHGSRHVGGDAALVDDEDVLRLAALEIAFERQRFLEKRHALATEARIEEAARVEARQLGQRALADEPVPIRRALERRVGDQHQVAAGARAHVAGDAVETEVERALEARQRVLGRF